MQESGAMFRPDHAHDLAALRSQLASQRVLVVAAEVAHDLLQVDGEVHRLFVDRQMLVSSHSSYRSRGDTPLLTPPKSSNHSNDRITEDPPPVHRAHTRQRPGCP